jgi:3-hydroxyisobutyrate dehydrogenase-like beta-hydroxyacid dehydrogenase
VALASAVAEAFKKTDRLPLFADANAISPMTSADIESIISVAGGRYVDASIIGHSSNVGKGAMFYVSGQDSSDFAQLNNFGLPVQVLGDKIGQASALKMVYAGFTKGLCCLMLEQLLTARSHSILDQIMEKFGSDYPETMAFTEWLLPGYPFRAARRGYEMKELTQTIEKAGLKPFMAPGSEGFLKSISALNLRTEYSVGDEAEWKLKDVINILHPRLANAGSTKGVAHEGR